MKFVAVCLLGLEGLVAQELRDMQAENVTPENGRVLFEGDKYILARANICSRYSERILLLLGQFKATTFTELFDNVKALPWENYVGKRDAFPVKGWSLQSQLHSIPDCQKIIKKAVVNRLSDFYGISWFEETGHKNQIQFSIHKDNVSIMIDTSGAGLHKRGYRATATAAPIKETLAAAMASLARLYPDSNLYDPFCGSGTILIESAMLVRNIAPGHRRGFAAERFDWIEPEVWSQERARAREAIIDAPDFKMFASDIDPQALELCKRNATLAGVADCLHTKLQNVEDFTLSTKRGVVITNPPYGERLLDIKEAQKLYKIMGERFIKEYGWRYYAICPDEEFETLFGRVADKRRKLYNGMIKCQYYMYFKN